MSRQEAASPPPALLRGASLPANPSVADAYGTAAGDPGLRGGWVHADGGTLRPGRYGVNRDAERRRCRALYFLNPLFQGALRIATSFLIGDAFTYGEVGDRTARLALEEFWQANTLGSLMGERWLTEYFLDGENATVWPTGEQDPGPDAPARIAFLDVDAGVHVDSDTARGTVASDMVWRVRRSQGAREVTYDAGTFTWTANDALWNDPRGWPLVSGAADAAMAYIALANHRLNIHEVQQRVVGVYTAMLNPEEPDGGEAKWRMKAGAFRSIPARGAVIPLITKPGHTDRDGNRYDGVTEKLEFPQPASGARDAAEDMGVFLRLVGLCMGGLPEHWLMEGGNVNRATAGNMSLPAVRLGLMRQLTLRSYLDRVLRTELERRWPGRLYRVPTTKVSRDGLSSVRSYRTVPARLLEFPWVLPGITEESLDTTLRVALAMHARGWVSDQTAASRLGADVPTEVELMAAAGRTFGTAPPRQTPGGDAHAQAPDPTPSPGPAAP